MMRKLIVSLPLVVCLAGCTTTLAPKYTRPAAPVPWAFPDAAATGSGTPAADMKWRDFVADARLQQVIQMALANNRDLRVATLNIEKARALYRIQRAELLPTVNAVGEAARQRLSASQSATGSAMTVDQYSANLGVSSWEIDFFGRIRSLKARALAQYLGTEQARRSAQISLVSQVADAYLTLAAARDLRRIAQAALENRQAYCELVQSRAAAGVASQVDLNQAKSGVDLARLDVASYDRQAAGVQNALNLLAGGPVPAALLPGSLDATPALKDFAPGVSSAVLLSRPDILEAENQLKGAYANIGAARAAYFPRIALSTSVGAVSGELSNLFKSESGAWAFAPQVSLPIFDAGARAADLKAAKTDRDIALAQYEKAIQGAFRETADALVTRKTAAEQEAAQQAQFDAAADNCCLAEARCREGIDSALKVLDAKRSMYASEQSLIAMRLARLNSLITLYKVLGGGAD